MRFYFELFVHFRQIKDSAVLACDGDRIVIIPQRNSIVDCTGKVVLPGAVSSSKLVLPDVRL